MYKSEQIFIDKFFAMLKLKGQHVIPYGNTLFNNGVKAMHDYFTTNKLHFGKYSDELSMLFLQSTLGKEYFEFENAVDDMNDGSLIIFRNPNYVEVEIKMDFDDAEYLLGYENLDIADEHLSAIVDEFIVGAGLAVRVPV